MTFACRFNWRSASVSLGDIPAAVGEDVISPATAVADLSLATDGTGSYDNFNAPVAFNWYAPTTASIGSSYWCRLTVLSGSALAGSATGTILALSSARAWSLTRSGVGSLSSNVTLEIFSDAAGTNLVASRSFTISATVSL